MRTAQRTATALLIVGAFAVVTNAQPPRDAPAAAGTSVISGIVVSDETPPRPLRRARVSLSGSGLRPARTAITQDNGSFRFDRLPAGHYTVRVVKEPYVALAAGAARPGRTGTAVSVREGETGQLTLRMARGGVISGVVTGSDGQPVPGVSVTALVYRYQPFIGERRLASGSLTSTGIVAGANATTDDRGLYRLFGLAPDEYFVVAMVRPLMNLGEIRTTAQAPRTVTFSPVYFPGTPAVSQATPITLAKGEERTADIVLQLVSTAKVEGSVVSSLGGIHPPFQVMLLPNLLIADGGPRQATTTNSEGTFAFRGVAPGAYVLLATAKGVYSSAPAAALMATTELNVDGEDVSNVVLTLQPGLTLSGRVTFEGAPPPVIDFSKLRIPMPSLMASGAIPATTAPLKLESSGAFTIEGVMPGVIRIGGTAPIQGVRTPLGPWWLKSISIDGREILDRPIELRQSSTNVVVAFSDRASTLSGRVADAHSQPSPGATVVVFSTDQASWFGHSRRIAGVRTGTDGTYSIRNLPAGEYFVAVSFDVEQNEWFDPVLLRRLAAGAQRTSLNENEQKSVELILR